ncbi:MAG: TetR/AcrR family transcriptional regulator [Eubacterium sp.]|nr:TetR/AcrR family transcriptional regulator [Candidatus Colimonas fimequi]
MARNKYPERTVEKILNVSEELFLKKGYANTSMQDIINALSSEMTKGAIYHHFKSKDDMYSSIVNKRFDGIISIFEQVLSRDDLNGAQKITLANSLGAASEDQDTILNFMAQVQRQSDKLDPTIAAFIIRMAEEKFIPVYTKMAEEGVRDGSIKFEHPEVVAEAIVYVIFVWLSCRLTVLNAQEYGKRTEFVGKMFDSYGIKVISEEGLKVLTEKVQKHFS